LLKNKV